MDNSTSANDLQAIWSQIAGNLKTSVSEDSVTRWFQDAEMVSLTDEDITVRVPNNIHQLWIETNYLPLLRSAIVLVVGTHRMVRFVSSGETVVLPPEEMPRLSKHEKARAESGGPAANGGMNPKNTFESFVVGKNNDYAHAACLAVGNAPGRTYNPLFIYGGVGLGKTHLMHAIGQHIAGAHKKHSKVVYITSEQFTNEFIDAIQNSALIKFRKRYRLADVLLIDDIQFLAGKERSQEE